MAEPVEVRRVVIEYTVPANNTAAPMNEPMGIPPEWVEAIRRELIRTGSRNPDIFGGRA
jgi:hypothetical protein